LQSGAGSSSGPDDLPVRIGVLAVQGGFQAHLEHLGSACGPGIEIRRPEELTSVDGLIIPGGESTTISKGIERDDLAGAIEEAAGSGMPVLGTCAGMILLGNSHLGLIDIETRRNAFGRQLASFEADIEIPALVGEDPIRAVFIRAPWVEKTGKGVEVLAEVEGHPVAVSSKNVTALSFHPELSGDDRIHSWFAAQCREWAASVDG
jgi:5'-phosphate synthase pdxT subunit